MYTCPSCKQATISYARKWLSWSAAPARCVECGESSAIAIADASGYLVASLVLVTLSGFAAVWVQGAWPLALGVSMAGVYYFWRQHTAPLLVVTGQEQRVASRSAWLGLLIAVFPSWFS
jgi:hypothetical protein